MGCICQALADTAALGRHRASRSVGQRLLRIYRGADLCFTIVFCRACFGTTLVVKFRQPAAEQRHYPIPGRHILRAGIHPVAGRLAADE